MAETTGIEWCDSTFNPWIGCTRVSPACDDCYAARSTPARTMGIAWGPAEPRRRTSPSTWKQPLAWERAAPEFFAKHGRRRRVFCASLADVFDNEVPPEWRAALFALIASTPNLDWLLLTKRIGNVAKMIEAPGMQKCGLPANVWLGATVVNQAEADRDIPKLLAVPARVRFLSIEPMLGPISLDCWPVYGEDEKPLLHWVIVGGESGPKARPMHPDWARSLRDQCAAAGVPLLFKQWGEWLPISEQSDEFNRTLYRPNRIACPGEDQGNLDECYGRTCRVETCVIQGDGTVLAPLTPMAFQQGANSMLTYRVGKKAAGRLLDGVEHNGFPAP